MRRSVSKLVEPAVIASVIVISFIVLEFVNTQGFATFGFPLALFATLWILTFIFVVSVRATVQDLRTGTGTLGHPFVFVLRSAIIILIAVIWVGLVNDQMPCFMGVPNCD